MHIELQVAFVEIPADLAARVEVRRMTMKVLLVDDDSEIRRVVPACLARRDIRTTVAKNGREALEVLNRVGDDAFDAILLDVSMPGESGLDVLTRFRARDVSTPVLFVTARTEISDRIRGLERGADDYVTKPFDPEELAARINAVVRRARSMPTLHVRGLDIDVSRRVVEAKGRRIDLSPREFEVLKVLAEARGEVVSRAFLLTNVWGYSIDPGTVIVEVQIARLRKKLRPVVPNLIQTVAGEGYRISLQSR